MRVLKFTLTLCAITGCCQPFSWITLFQRIVYTSYKMLLFSVSFMFNITQVIGTILNTDNSEIADVLYMTLAVFVGLCKIINMWSNRTNIRMLVNDLTEKFLTSFDSREIEIWQKYDKMEQ